MGLKTTYSTCYMCTADCPITVISEGERIVSIDHPDCVRAAAMLEQREKPERLTAPLIRDSAGGPWMKVSYEEAMTACAGSLQRIRDRYGPASVVFAVGYTKEARPYLRRLARIFGSPHYITESSCCFCAGLLAASITLGREYWYFLAPSRRRYGQTKCRLVWSNNPSESQPPYDAHHLLADAPQVPTIVVDPRATPLARAAALHLRLRPGTDGALALGLAHVMFEENLQDREFLHKHAYGVEPYRKYITRFSPDAVSRITGVPQDLIIEAARLYARSRPAQITISPNATTHHSNGLQAHRAILLLAAASGNLDVEGGNRPWSECFREKDVGLVPSQPWKSGAELGGGEFPLFVRHCGEGQGMRLRRAIDSGSVKAVFSIGMNLMMWPDSKRLEDALRSLEFFATADFFANPTVEASTLFFPAATHLERQALVPRGNGKVQYRPAAVAPRGEARGDTELVFGLADRLGMRGEFWDGDIHASYDERLEGSGLRFADLPGDGRILKIDLPRIEERSYRTKGFGTPTGRVEFVSTELEEAGYDGLPIYAEPYWSPISSPELAKAYPLILTTGGRTRNYTHSQGRELAVLREREPEARLQIHPEDGAHRGIADGDRVEVVSPIGTVQMRAWLTQEVTRGVVHAFHGWKDHNINELIPEEGLDPISGFPPFKSSLCQVRRAK